MKNDNVKLKIILRIKNHWPAILIAFILGFLMILQFFYFHISLGGQYEGILSQIIDDELFYMARIKDVLDGHPTLGNAYLAEYKNQLPQQLFLPEWLLAQPLKLFNLDVIQGRIVYNFVLPALAFILTYTVFYLIYPSRFWANFFAVFLFFGLYLFKFTRPVIPQFVFLFWLIQFIFLWLLVEYKYDYISLYHRISKRLLLILNIFNFGLLFYLYPFYWTFYLVFFAAVALIYFFGERLLSKQFFKILAGGFIIGSFYFYLSFLTNQLPEYQETLTRVQLVFSRSPSEIKTVLPSFLILILFIILYRFKFIKINKEILFFIIGIVSILLITNQNILTGQKFEFGHYRMPAVFFLVFGLYYLWSKVNFRFKFIIAFLMVILSVNGAYDYAQRITRVSNKDIYAQNYRIIFDWFNENTPADSVIYANEEISGLIPVYTSNNVFYSRYANLFIMADNEVGERFILNNFFEEFDRDFAVENERAIWGVRYVDKYGDAVQANKWRKLLGLELKDETRLPEEEINKVLTRAAEIQNNSLEEGIEEGTKDYKADYFIWDKNRNPDWQLNNQKFLESVFENSDFVIYMAK